MHNKGFTLVEMMIVIAVIGVLAAIAYPSYQKSIIKTKRTEMMTEMQNIANKIESRKLAEGNYNNIGIASQNFPANNPNYTYSVAPATSKWVITATPIATSIVANDGTLTLDHTGQKCRGAACGKGNEWQD